VGGSNRRSPGFAPLKNLDVELVLSPVRSDPYDLTQFDLSLALWQDLARVLLSAASRSRAWLPSRCPEADPRSCVDRAKKNAAKGMPVEFKVLPGTTLAFDHSLTDDQPVVVRQGARSSRINRGHLEVHP
jgi:hypothetical protein